ncbi:MAG: VWA domain-containing protein [Phycisphaerales bacterium]
MHTPHTNPPTSQRPSPAPSAAPRTPRAVDGRWFVRFVRRAVIFGAVTSLAVHVVFMGVAYAVRIAGVPGTPGLAGPGNSSVEVAMMSAEEAAAVEDAELEHTGPSAAEMPEVEVADVMLGSIDGGQGVEDSGDLGTVGAGSGGSGSGDGVGIGEGTGLGSGGSGGGGATFFGVSARGSRFVYVVDVSGSMGERAKMPQLKRELITSLDKLPDGAQFLIYLFQSETVALGKRDRWIPASGKNKQWAEDQIRAVQPSGGTNPGPAFVSALSLKPRPDAIYFMTDGMFDSEIAGRIARMNKSGRTIPVHCIAFGERGSEALMRKIADESGGTYTFVEPPTR